jgi:SAM-dependent methyltransferase
VSAPEREQRFVFDEVAELYAEARPSYPAQLIDDLIAAAGLGPGSRVLELGCGPATASVLLAGRGYRLTCLEPGPRLAALARARLHVEPGAQVLTTTFEDWPLEAAAFDLVFAAQAFHWIDPAVRFVKSVQALRPGATLAIFANRPDRGDTALDRALGDAYAALAQQGRPMGILTNTAENFARMFDEAGLFEAPSCREYRWSQDYAPEPYLRLLQTHSPHRLLPPAALSSLLSAIGQAIVDHGGTLRVPYTTVLCHARAKRGVPGP